MQFMSISDIVVDARGVLCPVPVIETKKAMDANPDCVIVTLVDNEVSRDNVKKFGESKGCAVWVSQDGKTFTLRLEPKTGDTTSAMADTGEKAAMATAASAVATAAVGSVTTTPNGEPVPTVSGIGHKVLLMTKDYLGEGNQELGRTLMKTFWFCLTEAAVKPKKIYFINSGVKMVAEGSVHLGNLKILADAGVDIAACGICLDFYGLKEKVAIGSITNLYAISDDLLTEATVTM